MVFTVKARVLRELGAELISSDGIALYELVKNAIDAGSERVDVRIKVALSPSGYRLLDHELSGTSSKDVTAAFVDRAMARCFEASTTQDLRNEFRRQLTGTTYARARKKLQEFFEEHTSIEIEDWGCGMSQADLTNYYLTVGTPNRALQRKRESGRVLGEKGIGRLSAMRLGEYLEVITAPAAARSWNRLELDWSRLDDPDMDLEDFDAKPEEGGEKKRTDSGTLIRIKHLHADWSPVRLAQLSQSELGKLQDPFDDETDRFDLKLTFNGARVEASEELDREWLDTWHGFFDVTFDYVENPETHQMEPVLTGVAKFRVPGDDPSKVSHEFDEEAIHAAGGELLSLQSNSDYPATTDGDPGASARFDGIETLGPFCARAYWYNRQRSQREYGQQYSSFKRWLERWAGGLLMYRDGYRVYPYGASDDDWLELDPVALRARSFKLNRSQFVGYVRISSKGNPRLRDQTNRQGLCDAPEKRALIQALQYVIWKELGAIVRKYETKRSKRTRGTLQEIDKQVKTKSLEAKTTLRELGKRVPKEQETIQRLRDYVEDVEAAWSRSKAELKRQENQAETYMHLAGVGMLLEFVVHELNRVTHATLQDLKSAPESSLPPSLRSLSRQLQTLEKRLRILDPVSTPGRQRKELTDIGEVLQTLLDAHDQQFERHHIKYRVKTVGGAVKSNVVTGQMYQIFENLISNSVYWLTHHRAVRSKQKAVSPFQACIEVAIDGKASTVTFSDNGPGIDSADREKLYDPFFSKKPSGRGIGLSIVKNLCAENSIGLDTLPVEKGRIAGFVFRFV